MRHSTVQLQLVDDVIEGENGAVSFVRINKNLNQGEKGPHEIIVPEGLKADIFLVNLLKQCAIQKDLEKGIRLHGFIQQRGLLKNIFIGNALISMYAKCGDLHLAHQAFDELPLQDVVSWNSLITGYAQHGHGGKAIDCFFQMQHEGHAPNAATFNCVLKACSSSGEFKLGKEVHSCILKVCYDFGVAEKEAKGALGIGNVLGSTLVDMYAKCGALKKAQAVFDELNVKDIVSWTSLINGYCNQGCGERAFQCFELMTSEGLCPDTVSFVCILKACGSSRAAKEGEQLHAQILKRGLLEEDIVLEIALLDMYAKCGAIWKARQVFNGLCPQDLVAWNSLITGYTQHGHGEEAIKCFTLMQDFGPSPDAVTFICILKACGSAGEADIGRDVHVEIVRKGMLGSNTSLGNALVDMYAKCSKLSRAQEVFDDLLVQDVVSWNALVTGYVENGHAWKALDCYEEMQRVGFSPSSVTFGCILKACSSIEALEKGREIHAKIVGNGLLECRPMVGNALIDMYSKCAELGKAQQIFYDLPLQDVVSWNVLISGFCDQGNAKEALRCFSQMAKEGLSPHELTFITILKVCGSIEGAQLGGEIHMEIARKGWLERGTMLGSALVDMYAKCGQLVKAQEVVMGLHVQNIISWNALITGYCNVGDCEEAINCFDYIKLKGPNPDLVTFTCILKACGHIGAVEKGTEVHMEIMRKGMLRTDNILGNTVIDMYSRCGLLMKAYQVFDELPFRDIISWNTLIMGFCKNGHGEEAINCLHRMEHAGLSPDAVTFASILKACGSTCAPDKGQMYFESMTRVHGVTPTIEHWTCMVYLDGLAGNFDKAIADIEQWPFSDLSPGWVAFLGACQQKGNLTLGKLAFRHALLSGKHYVFVGSDSNQLFEAAISRKL